MVIGGGAAGTISSALLRGRCFFAACFRSDRENATRAEGQFLTMPVQAARIPEEDKVRSGAERGGELAISDAASVADGMTAPTGERHLRARTG